MMFCEVEDFRKAYKLYTPKIFRDYCESGSWQQTTLAENMADFHKIKFDQKVAVNLENRSLSTTICGVDVKMPVIGAPVGMLGMQRARGEILAAKAFERFGCPFTLSTVAVTGMEDLARNTSSPFWFQLYVQRDRDFTHSLIERAKAVECSALVVTLDLQIMGKRHADTRNGLGAKPKLGIGSLLNIASHPKWIVDILRAKQKKFGNYEGFVENRESDQGLAEWITSQFDLNLNWDDVKRFREMWQKPLILKGIMNVNDAKKAVEVGADAIIVSNHGGRQLDGAPSAISMLPAIQAAVGDQIEILMDSGVRSGQDVLRAKALGAQGVMIGRAMVYALGAAGEDGVYRLLEILHEEMDLTMAFCGKTNINDVDQEILVKT